MLDFVDSNQTATLDPLGIDERSDAELDACNFGVIGLDPEGIVLRYNLYESRLARLDRNQVVGRNFFFEIAPCTRGDRFEGRFRAFVARGGVAPDGVSRVERFEYLFDFRFGAQEVTIDIVRGGASDRYYLLVNRRKVSEPRAGVPVDQLAAAQASLAPAERDAGVLRDSLERRYVDAPASLLAALRATCDRLAPESWRIFSLEWGTQWGRRVAIDLEAESLEKRGRSLRELPMRELSVMASAYFSQGGWGRPTFDLTDAPLGFLSIDVERSALAEAAPKRRADTRPEGDLACHLLAGAFGSLLSAVAGRRLAAREVACTNGGAPVCTLVVLGHERREEVDAALRSGARGLESMRSLLRGTRSGSGT